MRDELFHEILKLRSRHGVNKTFNLDLGLEINCRRHSTYMASRRTLQGAPVNFLDGCFECITIVDLYESINHLMTVPETIVRHIEDNNNYLDNILHADVIESYISVDHHTFYCCIRGR